MKAGEYMTTYNVEKKIDDENIDLPDAVIKAIRSCDLMKGAYLICVSIEGDAKKANECECTWQDADYKIHVTVIPVGEDKE